VSSPCAGQYDFNWITGRNLGYGFSSRMSDGSVPFSDEMIVDEIRSFMESVDDESGYL
jgi:hypothetical protein